MKHCLYKLWYKNTRDPNEALKKTLHVELNLDVETGKIFKIYQ